MEKHGHLHENSNSFILLKWFNIDLWQYKQSDEDTSKLTRNNHHSIDKFKHQRNVQGCFKQVWHTEYWFMDHSNGTIWFALMLTWEGGEQSHSFIPSLLHVDSVTNLILWIWHVVSKTLTDTQECQFQ